MTIRYATVLLICLSVIGCSSMHPMSGTPASAAEELKAGELIVIQKLSGTETEMIFTQVSNGAIHGTLTDGSSAQTIALADIDQIEARRTDGVRSALFVVATAIAVSAFLDALEAAGAAAGLSPGTF